MSQGVCYGTDILYLSAYVVPTFYYSACAVFYYTLYRTRTENNKKYIMQIRHTR